METLFQQEARGEVSVFLIDNQGSILWGGEATEEMRRAVRRSRLVRDFVQTPLNMTQEYTVVSDGREERMLGRVGPVEEAGWGVVMQRPAAIALAAVQEMVFNTAVSTAVLIAFALGIAVAAARGVSRPIQELADTTHQIAAGNFGQRVELGVASQEIRELADDFNRMSDHVRSHVEQLKRAAQINRDLFVGSMRSFVAAIDAKDPYTRGHSERVATYSRTISKFLGLSEEDSHQIWVGALLHDVGKIGIEDQILTKVDRLTDAEYDVMKQHTVIGAQIMSRIEQLKEMIPAIRWHHEAWNGEGYPDGLQGEQIPLSARIVAVADTFDAITTTRPYQKACDTALRSRPSRSWPESASTSMWSRRSTAPSKPARSENEKHPCRSLPQRPKQSWPTERPPRSCQSCPSSTFWRICWPTILTPRRPSSWTMLARPWILPALNRVPTKCVCSGPISVSTSVSSAGCSPRRGWVRPACATSKGLATIST